MLRIKKHYLLFSFFLAVILIAPNFTEPSISTPNSLDIKLIEMSLEEKIGQMFMLGVFSNDLESWKKEFLQERNIGGVILHPYNVESEEQLRGFIVNLQKDNGLPLFIAVNQEGGNEKIMGGEIATIKFIKEKRGGRVITDDIEMKAIRPFYPVAKAGADIIVVSGTEQDQKKSYEVLLNAVKSGEISEERINQSLRRILKVKSLLTHF